MNFKWVKFLGAVGLLLALAWMQAGNFPQASEQNSHFKIQVLDIGQGDAILLTTPNKKRILIDGGPNNAILSQLGRNLPFTERNFALVIPSHNHSDHISGLNEVLRRYSVEKIWLSGAIHTSNEYLELLTLVKDKKIPAEVVWRGQKTVIDEVSLEVIHPIEKQEGLRPEDQHDATLVVRACYKAICGLLTGDLEASHEADIVASGQNISAQFLKVTHHGSAYGTTVPFLDAAKPQVAAIPVGEDNSYDHPAKSLLNRLAAKNIPTYRTDTNGTIEFSTDGTNWWVYTDRK